MQKAVKTKDFIATLAEIGAAAKNLVVDSLDNDNLVLSARNLRHTKVVNSFGLNIYDLLYHDQLVLSRTAATELEQLLDNSKAEATTAGAPSENAEEAAENTEASNTEEAA